MTEWTDTGSPWPKSTWVTAEGDRVGTTVAGLGDVNGDGIPDVLVGAPGSNDSAGAVAVVYGRQSVPTGRSPRRRSTTSSWTPAMRP